MNDEQTPYPWCRFSFSISFTEERSKREISHTAEMKTLDVHSLEDFMSYAEQFLEYFQDKYKAGEFRKQKGFTLIEGNLEKFGIDGDGLHEFVRDY